MPIRLRRSILTPLCATPDPPDDPLRFEAYWPNEDSPLEDLVVLRGEDERLSVKAEVAGGVGEVEVYWVLDGRLNHQGLASDDVELTPGAHDHGRLFATDKTGHVTVVELPRIVKLPPLDLPEMQFGVLAHIGTAGAVIGTSFPYRHTDQLRAALDLMLDAGLTITMSDWQWNPDWGTAHFDRVAHELDLRNMDVIAIAQDVPKWASAMDVTKTRENTAVRGPWSDPNDKAQDMILMATHWPTIRYWMVAHESNLNKFYLTGDAVRLVEEIRTAALATFYTNPQAIIVGPGLTLPLATVSVPGEFVAYPLFLQALYDLGWHRYVDVVAIHPFMPWLGSIEQTLAEMMNFVDQVRAIMKKNGDEDGILWATSHGWNAGDNTEGMNVPEAIRAELHVAAFSALAERGDVSAALIYNFMDTWMIPGEEGFGIVEYDPQSGSFIPKPTYWAVTRIPDRPAAALGRLMSR